MLELGWTVKDKISGMTGVVNARCVYLKDGQPVEGKWLDEDRLARWAEEAQGHVGEETNGWSRSRHADARASVGLDAG